MSPIETSPIENCATQTVRGTAVGDPDRRRRTVASGGRIRDRFRRGLALEHLQVRIDQNEALRSSAQGSDPGSAGLLSMLQLGEGFRTKSYLHLLPGSAIQGEVGPTVFVLGYLRRS
jgi:hypothetical protein